MADVLSTKELHDIRVGMLDPPSEEEARPWHHDPLLIASVQHNHDCWHCRFRILKGQQAIKDVGMYLHYPRCPKSAKENREMAQR